MHGDDTNFTNARFPDGTIGGIAVAGGRIAARLPAGADGPPNSKNIDLGGALVVPGFVEGHIHLDTSFYGDAWKPHLPNTQGFDVRERVKFQMQNLATAAPLAERARNQLELCISQGTTAMRSHVMIDADVGLSHLEAILAVREAYFDRIDLELVAFPQSGILASPGTADLLDAAIGLGCDLIGGLDPATFDRDLEGHLDVVFGIAEKRGVGVDIHLHDGGSLGVFEIEQIAARTRALGLGGKVAVSHAYSLGDFPPNEQRRTAEMLAQSGVAIMTNVPGNRRFPPVAILRAAGVTVFSGSDNIRDSWWPYGDGDMLRRANLIGYGSGFFTDDELAAAFDVVTAAGAKALHLEGYGLAVGDKADFVTLAAEHIPEAVVAVPANRAVYKGGRLVAEGGKLI